MIGIFEIILRNAIDQHMTGKLGKEWLVDAIRPGGCFEKNRGCERLFYSVKQGIQSLGTNYNHDKLLPKLSFGFWTLLFESKPYMATGNTLLEIFVSRPFGTHQKDILKKLIKIRDLRNRIAHYEPICFDGRNISITEAQKTYTSILHLLHYLGHNPRKILYGLNSVPARITAISEI